MNRLLGYLRRLPAPTDDPDAALLAHFARNRDAAAFAELVRRHGPVVWGVCRRQLAHHPDAEDAFQATFLVLVRRAAEASKQASLGAWLHRVAVLTARNVRRGQRRRAATALPEIAARDPGARALEARLDIDAALLALPEKYRVPLMLCHLQGLSRREAAERLGCAEGTLSARLSRGLRRLRHALDGAPMAILVPASLAAATVNAAALSSPSTLAGVSPAVIGLTTGVLRMFWLKKLVLTTAFVVAGGLVTTGVAVHQGGVAFATDPQAPGGEPKAAPPGKPAEARLDPKADLTRRHELEVSQRRLEMQQESLVAGIAVMETQLQNIRAMAEEFARNRELNAKLRGAQQTKSTPELEADTLTKKIDENLAKRLEEALANKKNAEQEVGRILAAVERARFRKEVDARAKAAMPYLFVMVHKDAKASAAISIQEFGDGQPITVTTDDPRAVTKILSRIKNDPNAPKDLFILYEVGTGADLCRSVASAIQRSGFTEVTFREIAAEYEGRDMKVKSLGDGLWGFVEYVPHRVMPTKPETQVVQPAK